MNSRLRRPPVPTKKKGRAGRFHESREEQKETTHSNPIGQKNDPKSSAGIRISGLAFPPFLSASCIRRPCHNQIFAFGGEMMYEMRGRVSMGGETIEGGY